MKQQILLATILVVALLAVLSVVDASQRTARYYRESSPKTGDWKYVSRATPDQTVTFNLALKQQNVDLLEKMLMEDADPNSPVYAQHKTKQEVLNLIAPSKATQNAVLSWIYKEVESLGEAHIKSLENLGDSIQLRTTVALAEKLFNTEIHVFLNTKKNRVVIKHLGELSLPSDISDDIELVTGITEFPPTDLPFKHKQTSKIQAGTNGCNVPYSIKNLYNVPLDLTITNTASNLGIYAIQSPGAPEGFGLPSLSYFETANGVAQDEISCIRGNGAGDFNPYIDNDLEAHLDVQMSVGMTQGADICFYIMEYGQGWMFEFANYLFQETDAPWVVSMSYGWIETEQCDDSTISFVGNCSYYHIPNSAVYIQRTNVEFMKLGLIGHTLLAAAGDDGTSGTHGSSDFCRTLGPIYPAASPYVTTVGATSVEDGPSVSNNTGNNVPPICTNSQYGCACSTSSYEQPALSTNTAGFDTGGGFSQFSAMPSYQANAVNAYLQSGVTLPTSTLFNQSNRAFPDIGAVGEQVCLLASAGGCEFVGGSSASTPLIASLITLLNQDRLNAGKTTLGFINPMIYDMYAKAASTYFNTQFTTGNNKGSCPATHGFNANPQGGWNPLVGVGSPKFGAIRQYVANLP